jgi:uncharacterized integral membrane protein
MNEETATSPLAAVRRTVRSAWNSLLTVYYANSVSWRVLKVGALVFLGFFLWAGSNILLSVQPTWTFLHYPMAYGFLLVVYGPIHHLVVIPLALRWRRSADDTRREIGKRLPNSGLAVFLVAVVVLGVFPVGPVAIDFTSALDGAGADIDPGIHCVRGGAEAGNGSIHCHLTEYEGVGRIAVKTGDRTLATDDEPPFEFTIRESELASVMDEKQFRVVVYDDDDGELVRRYTRRLSMIDTG